MCLCCFSVDWSQLVNRKPKEKGLFGIVRIRLPPPFILCPIMQWTWLGFTALSTYKYNASHNVQLHVWFSGTISLYIRWLTGSGWHKWWSVAYIWKDIYQNQVIVAEKDKWCLPFELFYTVFVSFKKGEKRKEGNLGERLKVSCLLIFY